MSEFNVEATFQQGVSFLRRGDLDTAMEQLRQASDHGHVQAQFELAVILAAHFAKHEEAAVLYENAASSGHTDAIVNLGVSYEQGLGVSQDYARAYECFLEAAKGGDADGQVNVGDCFANGKGVTKAPDEAVRWYVEAGNQGDFDAQVKLATLLAEYGVSGIGIRWPVLPDAVRELQRRLWRA